MKAFCALLLFFALMVGLTIGVSSLDSSPPRNELSESFYYGLVVTGEGEYVVGNGYGDDFIVLINNRDAVDPSYAELVAFLSSDNTESYPYYSGLFFVTPYNSGGNPLGKIDKARLVRIMKGEEAPDPPSVCSEYAEMLHNNAEIAGIRAGYVIAPNHAFNVFHTTGLGDVYIDCTGTGFSLREIRPFPECLEPYHPLDKRVIVDVSEWRRVTDIVPVHPEDSQYTIEVPWGIYIEKIVWDGEG